MVATLKQLVANLAPLVKRVSHNGRDYLVAPASLIVPGVLNGSDGAGYYPPEENAKSAASWDGVPLVAYHPLRNGEPVAAQDPEHKEWVWTNSGLGHLRNTRNNGKLTSEAWFDEELVKNYDKKLPEHVRIHPRLTSNRPIELSTGLMLDKEVKNGVCPRTGKSYEWVARNYKPDHLAVLPDQRGACSNEDGCGIVVNAESDSEGKWVTLPNGVHIMVKDGEIVKGPNVGKGTKEPNSKHHESVREAHEAGRLAPKSLDGDPSADASRASKVADKGGRAGHEKAAEAHTIAVGHHLDMAEKATRAKKFDEARDHRKAQYAHEAARDFHEQRAKEYVHNTGKHGNPQHAESGKYLPHGSGTGKGEQHSAAVESHKNVPASKAEEDGEDDGAPLDNCTSMPMTTKNADGWVTLPNGVKDGEIIKGPKIKTTSKEAADKKLDEDAKSNKTHKFPHGKNILEGKESSSESASFAENTSVTKHKQGDMTMPLPANERVTIVNRLVANCRCSEEDAKVINTLSDAALMSLNAMESDGEQDSAADDEETNSPKKKLPPQFAKNQETTTVTTVQNAKPQTAKEWMDSAPPEIREVVTNALKVDRRAKEQLIQRLVGNKKDEEKAKYSTYLSNKSLDELETLVELMPTPVVNTNDGLFDAKGNVAPVFTGANGGYEGTRNAQQDGFVLNADPEMDPQWHLSQKAKATAGSAA